MSEKVQKQFKCNFCDSASVSFIVISFQQQKLGSVAGPVIQENGRLSFEDDLRSGGLLCFISMNAGVRTELADSMVTPGEPGGD